MYRRCGLEEHRAKNTVLSIKTKKRVNQTEGKRTRDWRHKHRGTKKRNYASCQ